MRLSACSLFLTSMAAVPAFAGPASGTVQSPTGTISPAQAVAYVVRDMRNARTTRIEVMLTDVAVNATRLQNNLDPHVTAINLDEVRDRNYVLLWLGSPNTVSMNATYSKTMTQYLNDTSGGLKAELTTHTATKVEGRVFSTVPLEDDRRRDVHRRREVLGRHHTRAVRHATPGRRRRSSQGTDGILRRNQGQELERHQGRPEPHDTSRLREELQQPEGESR